MGIVIHQNISKSVTRDEWERVYEETLVLVQAFPLGEMYTTTYEGEEFTAVYRTKERKHDWGTGWAASMDYDTLYGAEEYTLPRDLVGDEVPDPEAGDGMMGAMQICMDTWSDERFSHTYSLWGNKTQGKAYHMYLLAIACLIEDCLGEKAFVHGNITRGQCRKAVELANRHLERPICVPAACETGRLYRRIQGLPLSEVEKVHAFEHFYKGTKDRDFYTFEQEHFGSAVINAYWKRQFASSRVGTREFSGNVKRALSAGISLEELCRIASRKHVNRGKRPKEFIKAIMDTKLHLKEKDTTDCLDIDMECGQPYGNQMFEAEIAFGSAHNPKVDRYLPIEEIRAALKRGMGAECDVDKVIDRYLEEEAKAPEINILKPGITGEEYNRMVDADAAEVLKQIMARRAEAAQRRREQYDVVEYGDLIHFKRGDRLVPGIEKMLGRCFKVYHGVTKGEPYQKVKKRDQAGRRSCLIFLSRYLPLRDRDWEHIFQELEEHEEALERYYPAFMMRTDYEDQMRMVTAFALNDQLYNYARELADAEEGEIQEL